jgi:uncharacterized Zn-finger protein
MINYIYKNKLPLCCPIDENLYSHPKIYFKINKDSKEIICPYCYSHYKLLK